MTSIWPTDGGSQQRRGRTLSSVTLFVVLPALAGWAMLAALGLVNPAASLCLAPRPALAQTMVDAANTSLALLTFSNVIATAVLMMTAMSLPLAWRHAIHVRTHTFARHSATAVVIFVLSFGIVWIVVLAFLTLIGVTSKAILVTVLPAPALVAIAAFMVAFHRTSNEAGTALVQCHRMDSIRPFQPTFVTDTARFGARSALYCARACWPAMLLPWLSSRPLLAMAVVTLLAFADRMAHRASSRPAVVILALFTLVEITTPL